MRRSRLSQILLSPHVSEKAFGLADSIRQHVFKVAPSATKKEVRAAVELFFDVKVDRVNLLNMRGKRKGMGVARGRRRHWKKAYVTLSEGHDIQLTGSE